MNKKQILICDDDDKQYLNLRDFLIEKNYEVYRSHHYNYVLNDLEKYKPIHLLILDLGFFEEQEKCKKSYVGHKCLSDVTEKYPDLKIIINSSILMEQEDDKLKEAKAIIQKLLHYPNIKSFLYPGIDQLLLEFEIDKAIGTSKWFIDDEIWILHISDMQFGGTGLPTSGEMLATKIWETIDSFIKSSTDNEKLNYPSLAFITGDLTQHGRPSEFDDAANFIKELSLKISKERPEMLGIIDSHNCIIIPGNHDMNWDISRARNIYIENGETVYKKEITNCTNFNPNLNFLEEYSWLPFSRIGCGLPKSNINWCWDPGYYIIDLKIELGIILVLLNSSKCNSNHISHKGIVSRKILYEIQNNLNRLDCEKNAARILLVHHTIDERKNSKERLSLDEEDSGCKDLLEMIVRTCGFTVVFTGHSHEFSIDKIPIGTEEIKSIHIGTGSARSDDLPKYRTPNFNIVKIFDRSLDTNKYKKISIYPFSWNGKHFCRYSGFDNGMKNWETFELKY